MRDYSYSPISGSVVKETRLKNWRGEVYKTVYTTYSHGTTGFNSKGRAELKNSDRLHATDYGAWWKQVEGGNVSHLVKGTNDYYYSGKAPMTAPSLANAGFAVYGDAHYGPATPPWVISSSQARHLRAVKDSSINLVESLSETALGLPEMYKQVVSLGRALVAVKRGRFKEAGRHLGLNRPVETVGSAYLGYNLGWKPLMSDIYNGQQAIRDAFNKTEKTIQTSFQQSVPAISIDSRYTRIAEVVHSVTISSTFGIDDADAAALAALGVTNPLEVAWALVPLSFVVDYFINVSSFLTGLDATRGLTYKHGFMTRVSRVNGGQIIDRHIYGGANPTWTLNNFCFRRTPLHDFVLPGVIIKMHLTSNQAGILLGLASQLR